MKVPRVRQSELWAWGALILLLAMGLPLFLRMPLWVDVIHHDICARNLLGGGTHYRDVFDTNLPGIIWLHVIVRSLLGWSSEAIRFVDFGVVSSIVWLLVRWLKTLGRPLIVRVWSAVALYGFYFSTSEHSHCQRDVWMLLPAVGALYFRQRQLARREINGASLHRAAAEGLCWGIAFWLKPFVIVPALLCSLLSVVCVWKRRTGVWKWLVADVAGVICGGLTAAAIGMAWLWGSGTWPHFWDVMSSWNSEYYASRERLLYSWYSFLDLKPYSALHLITVPLAVAMVYRMLVSRPVLGGSRSRANQEALLGGFYIGWLLQATLLQHGFIYHHLPAILLSMIVLAAWPGLAPCSRVGWAPIFAFVALAVSLHPLLKWERLSAWNRCLFERSTPESLDRMALIDTTSWQDLKRVADYLRSQNLRDGELTCFGGFTIPLYLDLNVTPATRFIQVSMIADYYPGHRELMRKELARSSQRYLVSDMRDWWSVSLTPQQALEERPGQPLALPPAFPRSKTSCYPWSEAVLFRAGRYFVHRASATVGNF